MPSAHAGRVLVVEGYMDVVALAQFDVGYAVATLGTATTPVHVSKLLRLTDELVFCFDGDAAGRKAAWRALEVSLPLAPDHKPIRFLFLPDGEDPDTFVRKHGREAFELRVRGARDPVAVPARPAADRNRPRQRRGPRAAGFDRQGAHREDHRAGAARCRSSTRLPSSRACREGDMERLLGPAATAALQPAGARAPQLRHAGLPGMDAALLPAAGPVAGRAHRPGLP